MSKNIRYIKNIINGFVSGDAATLTLENKWVEIKAIQIDDNNHEINYALNKSASTPDGTLINPEYVTNGNLDTFGDLTQIQFDVGLENTPAELIIDLGDIYNIDYVQIWHDYSTIRKYVDNFVSVSEDGDNWIILQPKNSVTLETSNGCKYWLPIEVPNNKSTHITYQQFTKNIIFPLNSNKSKKNVDLFVTNNLPKYGDRITKELYKSLQEDIAKDFNYNWTATADDDREWLEYNDYDELVETVYSLNNLTCKNNCSSSCSISCTGNCVATCGKNCGNSDCTHVCGSGCYHNCGAGCSHTCGGGCYHDCGAGCSYGCGGACQGGCSGECAGSSCTTGCDNNCSSYWSFNTYCVDFSCYNNCTHGCESSCGSGCLASCGAACRGGCSGACKGGCSGACKGGCSGACKGGCGSECDNGCRSTCTVYCDLNCSSSCSTSCTGTCITNASANINI